MLYDEKPADFNPRFTIVSCFLENGRGEILLLLRQDHKPQGNTWGVPAGKLDEGETLKGSLLREIEEETQIELSDDDVRHLKKVFVRYPEYDFVYHIFNAQMDGTPEVKTNCKEHKSFRWVSPEEALEMPLIMDLAGCIRLVYD